MTSDHLASHGGPDRSSTVMSLSSAFGPSAAASLVHRRNGSQKAAQTISNDVEVEAAQPDTEAQETDRAPSKGTQRSVAPQRKAASRSTAAAPPRRRGRSTQVKQRKDVDLLLLAATAQGPGNATELIERVRRLSGGVLALPESSVYHELHRLTNNRLMKVTWDGGRRRHLLTPSGERVLAARRREWETFSSGVDEVLATD
jgi:DNA-binding PadR family transcriptional regulator